MKAVKVKDNIYWVGAIDWKLRNFHGYMTQRGSTYNAYLIIDEKITLIDTVKEAFYDEMLSRISSVIDPKKIDTVISNHVEMDHSGALPKLMELIPNATVVTSFPNGEKGLRAHYKKEWAFQPVKSGDVLSLGARSLHFVQTPMIHWPDNMVSYCPEEKLLFSNDAFGQHIATCERFVSDFSFDVVQIEAKKYYANIVLPYGRQVLGAIDIVKKLDIDVIAPSHGLIWSSHISELLDSYQKWASNAVSEKAVIIYDTMWGSTQKIAEAIKDAFEEKGVCHRMLDLQSNHISDVMTEFIDAKYICIGSPTLNNSMLPTVAAFLAYMKGLAPKDRVGLAFGSYGWGGQSIAQVNDVFAELKYQQIDPIRLQYIPDEDQLTAVTNQLIDSIS